MTSIKQYDACIVGAGPAGCSVALQLSGKRAVIIIDRQATFGPRIGESLHPDSHQLLAELGLLDSIRYEGHAAYHGNRSVWGSNRPVDVDFVRHPMGAGWHLDRARFDQWLRDNAKARGTNVVIGARIHRVFRDAGNWIISYSDRMGTHVITAGIVVDAGGRTSPIARHLGARRITAPHDRLACSWVHLQSLTNHGAGLTIIEATSDGWWYTSPIPEAGRALAFLTDRDLPEAKSASNFENLPLRACESTLEVSRVLGRARNPAIVAQGYTSANGSFLEPPIGDHWLAVGDAALTIDPIAARGLLHALYTGSVAGASIERKLSGQATTFDEYARTVASLVAEYQRLWRIGYARETRFPGSTFWQRRVRQNSL